MRAPWLTLAAMLLAGCGTPPMTGDTVWVSVNRVFKPADLEQSWHRQLAARVHAAGLTRGDLEAGRLLQVECGLGPDYQWSSYAVLPRNGAAPLNKVLEIRVDEPSTDKQLGLNPVTRTVDSFRFPGRQRQYEFIPDWKEKGLHSNLRALPLQPGQEGRYVSLHSDYLIACQQRQR